MKIVVNDANILIDLANLDLLSKLAQLAIELHTNDFVMNEIKQPEQIEKVNKIVNTGKLIVAQTKSDEYIEIIKLQTKNLSFEDCSIWYYTKKMKGILLTGDNNLRKTVKASGIEVRGVLYVFDKLLENNIISRQEACEKLTALYKINSRLPKKEIDKRLNNWNK